MFYDSVCLKGPYGQLARVLVSECDDFEYCDVMIMTSWSHMTVVDDVTNRHFPIGSLFDTNPRITLNGGGWGVGVAGG